MCNLSDPPSHLVQLVSLGADVVHQDLVRGQLELYRGPGVLRLLESHAAPELMDHLNPQPGLRYGRKITS